MRKLWAACLLTAFIGCAARAVQGPQLLDIPKQAGVVETVPQIAAELLVLVDAGLPASWSAPVVDASFAECVHLARAARDSFALAKKNVAAVDGGPPIASRFHAANAYLDYTSRWYAAAYHAKDAKPGDRAQALHEAAEVILAWSQHLDDVQLWRTPASYRADPAVALTFEEVEDGPAKRWRAEGLALLERCVAAGVVECASMRDRYVAVRARDAGAAGCGCAGGDPLCSASLSGWCP